MRINKIFSLDIEIVKRLNKLKQKNINLSRLVESLLKDYFKKEDRKNGI